MEKKALITTLFLIIIALTQINTVHASTPDYTANLNPYTNYTTGNNEIISEITLTKTSTITEEYTLNNYSNHTFDELDRITWTNLDTIILNNTNTNENVILTTTDTYLFLNHNNYEYYNIINTTQRGQITINPKENNQITINIISEEPITPNNNDFELTDTTKISLTTNIDVDLPPKTYNYTIIISNNYKNISINSSYEVPEIREFRVIYDDLTRNIKGESGSDTYLGYVTFENLGNTNFDINTTITGSEENNILSTQRNLKLFRNSQITFEVLAQIPRRTIDGTYNYTLTFSSTNDTYEANITITVQDTEPPEILDYYFKTTDLYEDNTLTIEAYDNVELSRATIHYDNHTTNLTKDKNNFYYDYAYKKRDPYNFKICVYDIGNNSVCEEFLKEFEVITAVNQSTNNLLLPTKKIGSYTKLPVFTILTDLDEPLNITLISVSTDLALNDTDEFSLFDIRIIDGKNDRRYITNLNQTVQLSKAGTIYLELSTDELLSYDGFFTVQTPSYTESLNNINFEGKFLDYELPEEYTEEWFGGEIEVTVEDTGDLETSKRKIVTYAPISLNDDDLIIPVTMKQKELEEQQINATINTYKKRIAYYNAGVGIIIGIGIVLFFVYMYASNVLPTLRLKIQ